jgi:predicted DNA binding CopG/RHH family protein
MSKFKRDAEEKEILRDFEAGKFKSVLTPQRKKQLAKVAEETFKKDKCINIRISSRDLEAIQRPALEEGIPYQTLVPRILHKYVSESLYDVTANKSLSKDVAERGVG